MQILDQAVAVMRKRGADGARVAAQLEEIAAIGEQAARVWQGYLDQPGATGDQYSLVTWMGPDRTRELFDLSLKARHLVDAVCAAAGPEARFLVMDESPIVLAYVGLKEGESGPQAAAARLASQQAMNSHLRELAGQVRSLKASAKSMNSHLRELAGQVRSLKASAKSTKTAARAAASKPAARKAVKRAAKKKPVPKKKTAKKTAKKAAKKKK